MQHPIALLLAALAGGFTGGAHALPAASSSQVEAPGWTGLTVNYRCTDGRRLAVVYLNPQQGDALAVLATDGVQAVLRSLPSAAGARYADTDEQRGLRWQTQGDTGRLALMPADHTGSERTLSAHCRAQP